LISQFPNLRFVIRAGSGVDNIDQRALSARGVKLIRKPDLAAESVAELAAVSLLGLCRRLHQSMALLFRGVWAKNWLIGDDVSRFFVGIWGAGPVGRACYERFRGMCERVAFAAWPSVPAGLEVASADALMCQADAHIVCLPLRMNTVNKFDAGFFERSSDKRPYLINVARLGLMDLGAAFGALKSNRLRGFAVDGIDQCDMMRLESVLGGEGGTGYNFLVSQHLGAQRVDVHREMIRWLIAEVDHWVSPHA
jgi:D-3-phosphoglycerate dehydrogenase